MVREHSRNSGNINGDTLVSIEHNFIIIIIIFLEWRVCVLLESNKLTNISVRIVAFPDLAGGGRHG